MAPEIPSFPEHRAFTRAEKPTQPPLDPMLEAQLYEALTEPPESHIPHEDAVEVLGAIDEATETEPLVEQRSPSFEMPAEIHDQLKLCEQQFGHTIARRAEAAIQEQLALVHMADEFAAHLPQEALKQFEAKRKSAEIKAATSALERTKESYMSRFGFENKDALKSLLADTIHNIYTETQGRNPEHILEDFQLISAMSIDLDGLKAINDFLDHEHGDKYLQFYTSTFQSTSEPMRAVNQLARVRSFSAGSDEIFLLIDAREVLRPLARDLEKDGVVAQEISSRLAFEMNALVTKIQHEFQRALYKADLKQLDIFNLDTIPSNKLDAAFAPFRSPSGQFKEGVEFRATFGVGAATLYDSFTSAETSREIESITARIQKLKDDAVRARPRARRDIEHAIGEAQALLSKTLLYVLNLADRRMNEHKKTGKGSREHGNYYKEILSPEDWIAIESDSDLAEQTRLSEQLTFILSLRTKEARDMQELIKEMKDQLEESRRRIAELGAAQEKTVHQLEGNIRQLTARLDRAQQELRERKK